MEVIVLASVSSVVPTSVSWWETEDVVVSNSVQDHLLWGVQWDESGVIYPRDLARVVLRPLVVRLFQPHFRGGVRTRSETVVGLLPLIVLSFPDTSLIALGSLLVLLFPSWRFWIEGFSCLLGIHDVLCLLE